MEDIMKKVLALLLSVLMVFALAAPAFANQAPVATTTASATTLKRGDTVTFTVSFTPLKAITCAIKFVGEVEGQNFDTSIFSITSAKCVVNEDDEGYVVTNKYFSKTNGLAMACEQDVTVESITIKAKVLADAPFKATEVKFIPFFTSKPDLNAPAIDIHNYVSAGTTVTITHDCVPSSTYEKDAEGHWYPCTVAGCTVAPTKTGHAWTNACDTECDTCHYTRVITHDFTQQDKNDTQHWNKCSVCGTVDETSREDHKGGTATCQAKATCSVCGTPYGALAEHKWIEKVDSKYLIGKPSCLEGASYKKSCEYCGVAHATESFNSGAPDPNAHEGGTATCTAQAICTVCLQPYGDLAPHSLKEIVKPEALKTAATCNKKAVYYKSCDKCSFISDTETFETGSFDESKHVYSEVVEETYLVSAATCVEKAIYKKSCTVCGKAHATETFKTGDVNKDNHVGGTVIKLAEPTSCEKEGFTGNTHCASCDAKLADGEPIVKLPHVITEWTETKPATETEEGSKTGTCEECGKPFTVPTAKLTTSVKADNIFDAEGKKADAKVEATGDTKLPENANAYVADVTEEIKNDEKMQENVKEAIKDIKEAKDKDIVAAILVDIEFPEKGTTTGDAVENNYDVKLPGSVKITVPVSKELMAKYENVVLVTYDHATQKPVVVPFTYNNGYLSVDSKYASNELILVGNPVKAADPVVPSTGDASQVGLFITLSIVTVLTLGAMTVEKKRKASK